MVSEKGIEEFYLLTTTADKFFARNGFEVIDRNKVPSSIAGTNEFDSICPATAVCMRKLL
jgi:amino-acid N-acetyltransferase